MKLLSNNIYHGDCLKLMKFIPNKSIDIVITDPPYDKFTHQGGKFTKEIRFGNVDFEPFENYEFIKELIRITKKWIICFCNLEALGKIKSQYVNNYVRSMIWDRVVNSPQISGDRPAQACEGIALLHSIRKNMKWGGHGKAGIYREMVPRGEKIHPTQKPIRLIRDLINDFSIDNDEIIFDPFMGSGTTAVACINTNRRYIGIEKDKKYYDIACKRVKDHLKMIKQKKKFEVYR